MNHNGYKKKGSPGSQTRCKPERIGNLLINVRRKGAQGLFIWPYGLQKLDSGGRRFHGKESSPFRQ